GFDNIDLEAASEKNITVTNAPEANINAVSELVVGLMLSMARGVIQVDKEVRLGNYGVRDKTLGMELKSKVLGIIGFGNIGKLIAEKSHFGFGMNILVYDPFVDKDNC